MVERRSAAGVRRSQRAGAETEIELVELRTQARWSRSAADVSDYGKMAQAARWRLTAAAQYRPCGRRAGRRPLAAAADRSRFKDVLARSPRKLESHTLSRERLDFFVFIAGRLVDLRRRRITRR
jgi:hypothetical protein